MNAPFTTPAVEANNQIDFRLAFLERAAARLYLFDAGELELDEAFDGLLDGLQCTCSREVIERWERVSPPIKRGVR
jgi:hypothetical protein